MYGAVPLTPTLCGAPPLPLASHEALSLAGRGGAARLPHGRLTRPQSNPSGVTATALLGQPQKHVLDDEWTSPKLKSDREADPPSGPSPYSMR